jgi:dTDP-4-amino-4,6-dideoxygalactose transaminase
MEHLRRLRSWYADELADIGPGVELPPTDVAGGEALCWIDALAEDRDGLVVALRQQGIETRPFWKPVHVHGVHGDSSAAYPSATWVSAHALWLPSALSVDRAAAAAVGTALRDFVRAPSSSRA